MNKDELEEEEFPLPLKLAFIQYDEEREPFKKLHRLLDSIEILVKLHTAVIMSDYFRISEASDKAKGLLAGGLTRPSLGIWWQFARELCLEMLEEKTDFFLGGVECYVGAKTSGHGKWKGDLFEALEGNENLISFRNKYAHGATPPDEESTVDFVKFEKVFRKLVLGAIHFKGACLVGVEEDGVRLFPPPRKKFSSAAGKIPRGLDNAGKCFLLREDGEFLLLHPLLFCRRDTPNSNYGFFFYNDLRKRDVNMLEYDRSWRWRDEDMRQDLLGVFPIDRWKAFTDSEIQVIINRLTEDFKGRVSEIDEILGFIARPQGGPLMIWGGPGIGKSALLARAIQALAWSPQERANENLNKAAGVERFKVVRYFIRRSGQTNDANMMLDHLNEELEKFTKNKFASGTNLQEKAANLRERLRSASQKLTENERLVVFVDGLDEGTDETSLLEALPLEVPDRVALIYSSREIPDVRNRIWAKLDRERRSELTVHPLGRGEVRAMLYDFVNKYRMTEAYLEQVVLMSQGNPLYLKLLCQGLELGAYRLNDLCDLPDGFKDLYKDMIFRFGKKHYLVLEYLCLLAVVKDFLPNEVAADMMGASLQEIEGVVEVCRECLYDQPGTEEVVDYQLFHESMREFLLKQKPGECEKWKRKLADWCEDWKNREKTELSRDYAVKYRIEHQWEWSKELRPIREKEAESSELLIIRAVEEENFRHELFLRCGHAHTLRVGLFRAQSLLLKGRDQATRQGNQNRVLRMARIYQEEPYFLLGQIIKELELAGAEGHFERVGIRAEVGGGAKMNAMLALRGIWQGRVNGKTNDSIALSEKMEDWIERAEDEDLRSFASIIVDSNK